MSITERHAHALAREDITPPTQTTLKPLTLIAQIDGSMIPIVVTGIADTVVADKRKHRALQWKEARLSLIRRPGEAEPSFAVTIGDAALAGASLKNLAVAAGLHRRTHLHAVGDGAPWIAEQIEVQFGTQGNYLIDFYHLCDYLAAAAPVCAPSSSATWMENQKARFKSGLIGEVVADLLSHAESEALPPEQAPVRRCLRYLTNHPGQFNYPEAIAANLPIGSGEVESAHRYVIQKRLKLPGAWWTIENAQAMLNLRTLRANHLWSEYWEKLAAA